MIKITVPNDDHVALRAMAKALEEIAVARGAPLRVNLVTQEMLDKLKETPSGHIECETEIDATPHYRGDYDFNVSDETIKNSQLDNNLTPRVITALEEMNKQVEADTTAQQYEALQKELRKKHIETVTTPFIDTDSTYTPWDERIHSTSKALNSDGTWRLRRKPADKTPEEWTAYVKWVEEDIHTVLHGQSEDSEEFKQLLKECEEEAPKILEAMSQVFEPSVTPAGDDFHVDAGEVTEQEVAAIPAPPLPVPPVPESIAEGQSQSTMSFPDVMKFLTERHARISNEQVTEIITAMGLKSVMDLNTQPEHTGPFIARVKALLGE